MDVLVLEECMLWGIDGYDYKNTPIQVKQSDIIGRNVVDNFEEVAPDTQQILGSCELIPQ